MNTSPTPSALRAAQQITNSLRLAERPSFDSVRAIAEIIDSATGLPEIITALNEFKAWVEDPRDAEDSWPVFCDRVFPAMEAALSHVEAGAESVRVEANVGQPASTHNTGH